jgi:alkylhydroperoxidase family enzyme
VRRLTKDEHLSAEFATTWPQYDLDEKTRALLTYAKKLTQEPSMVEDSDIEDLRAAGWEERGIYEATALISFFNFSGRLEALLRGCRWIRYQKKQGFPKRLLVSQACQPVF